MPIPAEDFITFVLASIAMLIVPGPSVTIIVSNSLAHGARAGFINIAGTQAGLTIIIGIVALGLATLLHTMSLWFDWVRMLGAAYLIWLGYKLFTAKDTAPTQNSIRSDSGFFWQGFVVILTNPKAHLLFGAFLPQFIDPSGNVMAQVLFLGFTFMVLATFLDGVYALTAGKAGHMLSTARGRLVRRVSGGFLMGGGVWLATLRQS